MDVDAILQRLASSGDEDAVHLLTQLLADRTRLEFMAQDQGRLVVCWGKTWYVRSARGSPLRRMPNFRAAVDAGLAFLKEELVYLDLKEFTNRHTEFIISAGRRGDQSTSTMTVLKERPADTSNKNYVFDPTDLTFKDNL